MFQTGDPEIERHLVDGGRLILDLFNPSLPRLVNEQYLTE
jgi:hypothetical protein